MGKQLQRLKKNISRAFEAKQDRKKYFTGLLGIRVDGIKRVKVPNRPGYVYVRLGGSYSEIIEAVNEGVQELFDLSVKVTESDSNPGAYVVIGRDIGQNTSGAPSSVNISKHGQTHSFGNGNDPVWIYRNQLVQPLQAHPTTPRSMKLFVESDFYTFNNEFKYFVGRETANLTSLKPTTPNKVRWVTVYIDANESLQYKTGSLFTEVTPLFSSPTGSVYYIPEVLPNEGIPLTAVYLQTGTSIIDWSNIRDIRTFLGGGSSSIDTFITGSVLFSGPDGSITEDNQNFFWDDTTNTLVVGSNRIQAGVFAGFQNYRSDALAGFTAVSWHTGTPQSSTTTNITAKGARGSEVGLPAGTVFSSFLGNGSINNISPFASPSPAGMRMETTEEWSTSAQGSRISFLITRTGTTSSSRFEGLGVEQDGLDIIGQKFILEAPMTVVPTGSSGQVLTFDGSKWGPTTPSGGPGGTLNGTGTSNGVAIWSDGDTLHFSDNISFDGHTLHLPSTLGVKVLQTSAEGIQIGNFTIEDELGKLDISDGLRVNEDLEVVENAFVGGLFINNQEIVVTGASVGQILRFDGSNWGPVNVTLSTGTAHSHGATRLSITSGTINVLLNDFAQQLEFASFNGFIVDPASYSLSSGSNYLVLDNPVNTDGVFTVNYVVLGI